MTFENVVEDYVNFALNRFDTPALPSFNGLKREVKELEADIKGQAKHELILHEFADVQSYLIYILYRSGYTLDQLCEAMRQKTEINRRRTWRRNADGTYSHVK